MSSPTHIVFGTNAAFSHVPSFTKLAKALVSHSSEVVISIILHVNNVENVEKIISDLPADARARIKTFSVGEILPWKEVPSKGMMSLLWESGKAYGAVLAGTEWPAPSVVVFDVTAFFYPAVFSAVSAHFPHVKAPKVVAYSPVSISEVIHLIGEDRHGGLQWMAEELTKRDVPFASSEAYSSTEARSLESFLPPPDVLQKQIAAYMEVAIMNDRVINVPGCPPFHVYEKWSTEVNWHNPVEYGWFQYLGGIQGIGGKPDAWITCFPSAVFEPEALAAARDDKFMGDGKKPVFEAGWYEAKPTGLSEDVQSFLDKHDPKSVFYVSFGTVVDGGENIIALFDYLAESKTPFIYAYGYQKELLPGHIVEIIDEAEKDGRGLAPNWVDQLGVLAHPSTMCFISHCGANSIVESILAGVPILGWGGRFDQIQLASQVGNLKVGIELVQHRLGFGVGKSPASRPERLIEGTPAALKAEIKTALDTINGPAGAEYRQNAKKMGDAIRAKRTEWDGQVDRFIAWAKA